MSTMFVVLMSTYVCSLKSNQIDIEDLLLKVSKLY